MQKLLKLPDIIREDFKKLIRQGLPEKIDAAVILGSGLGTFTQSIEVINEIPYKALSAFPTTTVAGHKGSLIFGQHEGKAILAFSGRFHMYEGHTLETTFLPVRLASAFKPDLLVISNAAGAINEQFAVGDLVLIEDTLHPGYVLSTMGKSPFSSSHYSCLDWAHTLAAEAGIALQRGTYLYAKGPNYETKAEIRAFRRMGGDLVGMSTVPELIEAGRLHLNTVAISLVTNKASGVSSKKLYHGEIKEAADARAIDFSRLVKTLIADSTPGS